MGLRVEIAKNKLYQGIKNEPEWAYSILAYSHNSLFFFYYFPALLK